MIIPKFGVINAADIFLTSFIRRSLPVFALELGSDIKEIERKEDHAGENPLHTKVGKEKILISI